MLCRCVTEAHHGAAMFYVPLLPARRRTPSPCWRKAPRRRRRRHFSHARRSHGRRERKGPDTEREQPHCHRKLKPEDLCGGKAELDAALAKRRAALRTPFSEWRRRAYRRRRTREHSPGVPIKGTRSVTGRTAVTPYGPWQGSLLNAFPPITCAGASLQSADGGARQLLILHFCFMLPAVLPTALRTAAS